MYEDDNVEDSGPGLLLLSAGLGDNMRGVKANDNSYHGGNLF